MEARRTRILLAAILVIAAIARLPGLDRWPPAIHQDEVSNGVDAWSLLTTGADRAGRIWPVFLEGFGTGDNRTSLYAFLAIPGTALLGPGVIATRLPAALVGIWTVAVCYLFVRRIRGTQMALASAFLMALSPWGIVLSRFGHEASITPAFLITGLWLLSPGPAGPPVSWKRAATAGIVLGAGLYTYPSARLFLPVCSAALLLIRFGLRRDRSILPALIAALAAAIPLIVASASHPERLLSRAEAASLFSNVQPLGSALLLAAKQYAAHFMPGFLILHGDGNPLHSPAGMGQLLWIEAAALPIGVAVAIRRRDRWDRSMLLWLLLYPIASATTLGDRPEFVPHSLRAAVGLPVFQILSATGIVWLAGRLREWRARLLLGVACLLLVAANAGLLAARFAGPHSRSVAHLYHTTDVRAIERVARERRPGEMVAIDATSNPQVYVYSILFGLQTPAAYQTAEREVVQTETFHLVRRSGNIFYIHTPGDAEAFRPLLRGRVWAIVPPGGLGAGQVVERLHGDAGDPGLEVRLLELPASPPQRR